MSFDPSRLKSTLLNTGLQVKDNPLYQVINQLIDAASKLNADVNAISSGSSSSSVVSESLNEISNPIGIDGVDGVVEIIQQGDAGQSVNFNDGVIGLLKTKNGGTFTNIDTEFGAAYIYSVIIWDQPNLKLIPFPRIYCDNINFRVGIGQFQNPAVLFEVRGTNEFIRFKSTSGDLKHSYYSADNNERLNIIVTGGGVSRVIGVTNTSLELGANNVVYITIDTAGVASIANAKVAAVTNDTGLAFGVYTPTLTNVANLDASTAYECQYMRVGNTVTVSGKVDIDPTLAATSTQLGISLPIASNIGAAEDCAGTAFSPTIAGQGAAILGDATNNRAQMEWISGDITNQPMYFTFTYQVI